MSDAVQSPQDAARGRRSRGGGGAASRRATRTTSVITNLPVLERNLPLTTVLSEEGMAIVENNADALLQEVGIDFRDEEALKIWKEAGADVKGERVRFEKGMLRELCKTIPSEYEQLARNSSKNVMIGGKRSVFAPVYGPPFYRDYDSGRRYATINDFENIVKLVYMLPALHHSGGTVCEPVDVPVNKRHLDMVYAHLKYSDKPIMGSVTAPERAQDTVEMLKIVFGEEVATNQPCTTSLINVNSPMVYDDTMLGALKVYARNNQACIVSPFIIAGAMSPVTPMGTMTQALAEALAGLAFTQLLRPGSPMIFGTFAAAMSMQTGAPTFGTPEPAMVLMGMAQLARRMNVPFRSGGSLCGSKLPDAQAAYESMNTMYPAVLGGVNFVLHSAGWLEGGLVSSPEKIILDADNLHQLQILQGGPAIDENAQAMDALRETGPGNHFLGSTHTQANFETAFYRSTYADSNSFEQWEAEGAKDSFQRANDIFKKMMADYQAPAIDPGVDEALKEFVTKKKAEQPDMNY